MLLYDMVQDLQDYDTSGSTISQVRTMEVRSSNRREAEEVVQNKYIKKIQVGGDQAKTTIFTCN